MYVSQYHLLFNDLQKGFLPFMPFLGKKKRVEHLPHKPL